MRVQKVHGSLRVRHRLPGKAEEEENVVPEAGGRALLQDAIHLRNCGALAHHLYYRRGGRLQPVQEHAAARRAQRTQESRVEGAIHAAVSRPR